MVEIGQESHQLLVGVEVVRPGEIITRKDVLQKARTRNSRVLVSEWRGGCQWMCCLKKHPPKKTCGSQQDPGYLGSVQHHLSLELHTPEDGMMMKS